MKNVATLSKRELMAYFLSPIAYVILTVFLSLSGFLFYQDVVARRLAYIAPLMHVMSFLLLIVSPMLTMRLFADEFQTGTIETLMTAPVTTTEVVLSKYLASLFFLLVLLVPTMTCPAILLMFSTTSGAGADPGVIVASYLGLFLLGSFFIAVGMVASACVRAQVSAAVVAFVVLLTLTIVGHPAILPSSAVDWFSKTLRYISWDAHFRTFMDGKVDTRDVFYFLFSNVFCVFLTTVIVTVRKWR